MFWGLIMEPGMCYSQTVKTPFHVSMAAIDLSTCTDEPVQIMCVYEGRSYLLCTLYKEKSQCPLDLNFDSDTKVTFATNGGSHVHLTGYLTSEDWGSDGEGDKDNIRVHKKNIVPDSKNKKTKDPFDGDLPSDTSDSDFDGENHNSTGYDEDSDESNDDEEENVEEEELLSDGDDALSENSEDDNDEDVEEGEEDEDMEEEEEEEPTLVLKKKKKQKQEKSINSPSKKLTENSKLKQNGTEKKKNKRQNNDDGVQEKVNKKLKIDQSQELKKKTDQSDKNKAKSTPKKTLKGGVIVEDLKEGTGEPVKPGSYINVYYEGRLKQNNTVFDSTKKGSGFGFLLGSGEVIKGWDIGLVGMKLGGKRRLTCPPPVAYGARGSPPVIPPNSTLVFEVELKKIK